MSRGDRGVAAECLLAAFGTEPKEGDEVRALVGALLLADGLEALDVLKRAHLKG